jgi:hypothetical protein
LLRAVVASGPTGTFSDLLSGKAVFQAQNVVGEFAFVEKVAEKLPPLFVIIVADLEHAILDLEGVLGVFAKIVAFEFRGPAGEVFAVEEALPFVSGLRGFVIVCGEACG